MTKTLEEIVDYCRDQKDIAKKIIKVLPEDQYVRRGFREGTYSAYVDIIFKLTGRIEP